MDYPPAELAAGSSAQGMPKQAVAAGTPMQRLPQMGSAQARAQGNSSEGMMPKKAPPDQTPNQPS